MSNEYDSSRLGLGGRGVGSVYSNKTRMNTDNQMTETANLLMANGISASIGTIK